MNWKLFHFPYCFNIKVIKIVSFSILFHSKLMNLNDKNISFSIPFHHKLKVVSFLLNFNFIFSKRFSIYQEVLFLAPYFYSDSRLIFESTTTKAANARNSPTPKLLPPHPPDYTIFIYFFIFLQQWKRSLCDIER